MRNGEAGRAALVSSPHHTPEIRLQFCDGMVDHCTKTVDAGAGEGPPNAFLHNVEDIIHHAGGQLTLLTSVHRNSLPEKPRHSCDSPKKTTNAIHKPHPHSDGPSRFLQTLPLLTMGWGSSVKDLESRIITTPSCAAHVTVGFQKPKKRRTHIPYRARLSMG